MADKKTDEFYLKKYNGISVTDVTWDDDSKSWILTIHRDNSGRAERDIKNGIAFIKRASPEIGKLIYFKKSPPYLCPAT